jgi:hypothetical protein
MNVLQVLLLAWAAGLVLERRGDKLVVKGLKPDVPPELLNLLREHKPALLAVMTDQLTP